MILKGRSPFLLQNLISLSPIDIGFEIASSTKYHNHRVCLNQSRSQSNTFKETRKQSIFFRKDFLLYNSLVPPKLKNYSTSPKKNDTSCWSCEAFLSPQMKLKCPSCERLQPIPIQNYFKLFSLPSETFEIDLKLLERNYRDLVKKIHPDFFQNKSEKEKGFAERNSAFVTTAYNTLLDRKKRAHYLLSLVNQSIEEQDKLTDQLLLMEFLEQREELESANSEARLKELKDSNDKQIQEAFDQFTLFWNSKEYQKAKQILIQIQYLSNIADVIRHKLPAH